ncbi:unnamed protein product [Arctogadus glacialis]
MKMMNQLWASCWTCLLLSMLLCEPVLCKGGRGGSRGSSRGTSSRSSNMGKYNGAGTRSRYRSTGRSSAVRVAAAAAAGAAVAVALTADGCSPASLYTLDTWPALWTCALCILRKLRTVTDF